MPQQKNLRWLDFDVMKAPTNEIRFPFSQNLFWDANIADIDLARHQRYIVERVVTRGNMDAFKKLNEIYHRSEIVSALVKSKQLDKRTAHFCSWYYNILPENLHVSSFYR
jgi:hypothetical protein